jgi:translation initiation factor IF-2
MYDDQGKSITEAGPSTPVEVLGLENVPTSGDPFVVVSYDSQAKQLSARLQQIQRERELRRAQRVTLEDLYARIKEGRIKELNLVVKGDVQGSVEALCSNLEKIESAKVKVNILHSGVGAISESDTMLASASNALVIGFNVRPTPRADDLARQEGVEIRTYRVIYDAISAIRDAMTGLLEVTYRENILGRGEVREVFRMDKGLSIAGSYVQDGRLTRNAHVRILRDAVVIHEGKLVSLRRFKEDVREVPQGMECGIGLERFNDLRVGDVVECYELEEVAPTL